MDNLSKSLAALDAAAEEMLKKSKNTDDIEPNDVSDSDDGDDTVEKCDTPDGDNAVKKSDGCDGDNCDDVQKSDDVDEDDDTVGRDARAGERTSQQRLVRRDDCRLNLIFEIGFSLMG